jgi:hypothetical protein
MKRARSTAYPVLDLASAYRILRQDLAGLGTTELNRHEIAKKIGYNDALGGLAARKIGALAHYGLLVRRGSNYGLSPLGLRLQTLDIHDAEFLSAIRAALEHPSLFRAILDRHRTAGRIPHDFAEEMAAFGITEKASADAVEVFRNSALFAEVLDTEGVFLSEPAVAPSHLLQSIQPTESSCYGSDVNKEYERQINIPLLLFNGSKGSLVLPRPFGANEYLALKESFLAVYKILPAHLGFEIPAKGRTEVSAKAEPQESKPPLHFTKPTKFRR